MHGTLVKDIRKQLSLTQSQLAGPLMTRNLLSLVENGRAPLTQKTAEALAERINGLRGSDPDHTAVSPEDFLIPGRYQARLELKALTATVSEFRFEAHFNVYTYLVRFSFLFAQWDLPAEKYAAYILIGDHFEFSGRAEEAHLYYTRAFENALRLNDSEGWAHAASSLMRVALKLENYQSVILTAEALRGHEHALPRPDLQEISLHQVAAAMALDEHDKALDTLVRLEHLMPDPPAPLAAQILYLKAECYVRKGMLGIAARILDALSLQARSLKGENAGILLSAALLGRQALPSRAVSPDFEALWTDYTQNPDTYSGTDSLLLKFMESAISIGSIRIFNEAAWRVITCISPQSDPGLFRRAMALLLKGWQELPTDELPQQWELLLDTRLLSDPAAFADLLLDFLALFQAQGRDLLISKGLRRWLDTRQVKKL